MHDLVFRDVDVADGSGAARYRSDVGVEGGRIVAIGAGLAGLRIIDGRGRTLAPGFIDMHSHSDWAVATDDDHSVKLAQGCTLEVLGQDGLGYVPATDDWASSLHDRLSAWNGPAAPPWRTVADYLAVLDEGRPVNAAYLVPHGAVRMAVMGWADRAATATERDAMCALVAEGLAAGAVGLSAGLTYPPGMYAAADELIALCRVVADHNGYFCPHQRSYGAGALDAYREMIDIARISGCRLHLAHATMNFAVNSGRGGELLDLVDAATDLDISLDSYPYLPGATSLAALLPSWSMSGGPAACASRLVDPVQRERVRFELDVTGTDGCHGVPVEWDRIEISGVTLDRHRHLVGRSVADAAGGGRPSDFYLDLLLAEDFAPTCLMHVGHEDNVRAIMRHDRHTVGTDGLLYGDRPHPRAWGTFPRYLGRYTRELGLFTVEECVARMTSRPARVLGLTDRGRVDVGYAADLVLFDPAIVADTATFAEPRRTPIGIDVVVVNGAVAIDEGRRTEALAGRAMRRPT
ncbi:N-acyl-D-amino-acid deacylase family protein [Stackebrandtia soli]|uniref:N-acyl-D-amino-acid deacylase family protein n=1 Tax=Stackebrandtia soli TaxID=1892856 RepID=UPI0039ED6162